MPEGSRGFESWTLALSAFAGSRQSAQSPLVNASSGPHVVATSAPDSRVHRDRKVAPSQYTLWQPDERKLRQQQQEQRQRQQKNKRKPQRSANSHAECADVPLNSQPPVRVLVRSAHKGECSAQGSRDKPAQAREKDAVASGFATGLASSSLTEKQKAYQEARRQIFGD
ncbi:hypothetical protein LPJ56_006515 [Coemansia sp. RSA 2599]|nr:hypothetical protein LPJ75_006553 [Coemansia sp. RSA 2598]KAJ1805624.1 hypothetical protein LPJ56_006515 [Coemansia sp. RSA 2599]